MPIFNAERFLRRAIESILNQSFSDFAFLIINDGSSDSSEKIILSYKDSRIQLIKNITNLGVIQSLNKGIELSSAEFIARQDADDISLPQRLQEQVNFLEKHSNIGLVGTCFMVINEKGEPVTKVRVPTEPDILRQKLNKKNQFAHGSVLIRRECLEKVGLYRKAFKHCEDYDLWLRLSEHYNLSNLPEYLYQWRLVTGSISTSHSYYQKKCAEFAFQLHQERLLYGQDRIESGKMTTTEVDSYINSMGFGQDKNLEIQSLCEQGFSYLVNDRYSQACQYYLKSFKLNKFKIKTWLFIIIAILKPLISKRLFRLMLSIYFKLVSKN